MAKDSEDLPNIHLNSFIGGESIDLKNGIASSFFSSQAMDFRQTPSQMTVLPGMRTLSGNLKDKILDMDQDIDGNRYGVGDAGWLYKIDENDHITRIGQLDSAGAAGVVYNQQNSQLYMTEQQAVSLYGQIGNNPQLLKQHFGPSASVAPGVIYTFNTTTSSYDGGTVNSVTTRRNNMNTLTTTGITPDNYSSLVTNTLTNTYVLQSLAGTVPSEDPGTFCAFIPDIEPFYGVAVFVTTVGSGDWTLTMHDSMNNNLGDVTITNANVHAGWNIFTFDDPGVRAFVNAIASANGATGYHWHMTTNVAGDTAAIATINASDLTGANFILFAHRLVKTANGWHPMCIFNQYLCIGNGNYLSVYNFGNDASPHNGQWVRHRLFLDVGVEVTGLSPMSQFLVITAERRSNNTSRNYQGGFLYTWDGINNAPNRKVPIPAGAPYSPYCQNDITYFYCAGYLMAYGGGTSTIKIRPIGDRNTDYLGTHDHTIVNPNMMDTRYNLLMLGYPSSTTNTDLKMGIYSWGAVSIMYPNSFGYSYLLADEKNFTAGGEGADAWSDLQIGLIKNFVDTMYASWQYTDASDVVHYGLDVVDNTSSPARTAKFRTLTWDGSAVWKAKRPQRVLLSFLPLPAGVTINGVYELDRMGEKTAEDTAVASTQYTASENATSLLINIPQGRSREASWGFDVHCKDGATSPTMLGVTAEIDPLPQEPDLRAYQPDS